MSTDNLSKNATLAEFYQTEKLTGIRSTLLDRDVDVELFTPLNLEAHKKYPLLILNDGQDSRAVRIKETLERLVTDGQMAPIIVAGITAGDRLQEYGMASRNDYLKRGKKARYYSKYIITELIPYLNYRFPIDTSPHQHAIAGYSLGGLSAIDIGWNHPDVFTKIGVFSGSLWWRKRDTKSRFYSDQRDRLMHQQVRRGKIRPGLQFWFQTGTQDERGDRNKNGIIDSIDDTLDLITELTVKGYRPFHDIQYLEIKDGKHNTDTWAEAMPFFLKWAFPAQ